VLVAATGSAAGPAYFMLGCALVTLIAMLFIKRHEGRILERAAAPDSLEQASFPAH